MQLRASNGLAVFNSPYFSKAYYMPSKVGKIIYNDIRELNL